MRNVRFCRKRIALINVAFSMGGQTPANTNVIAAGASENAC